jgi:hypothetical protein
MMTLAQFGVLFLICCVHDLFSFRFPTLSIVKRGCIGPVTLSESKLQLQLRVLQVPVQQNVSNYEILVKKKIDEKLLIRWYIGRFDQDFAYVEAIHEEGPKSWTT